MVVIGLGKNLLFISVLAHCDVLDLDFPSSKELFQFIVYDKISVTFFCFFIAGGENVRICSGLLCRLLVTLSHLLSLHIS